MSSIEALEVQSLENQTFRRPDKDRHLALKIVAVIVALICGLYVCVHLIDRVGSSPDLAEPSSAAQPSNISTLQVVSSKDFFELVSATPSSLRDELRTAESLDAFNSITATPNCPFYRNSTPWFCGDTSPVPIDPCQVGTCPNNPQKKWIGGWMVRAEPCGDEYWKFNMAWGGIHITMVDIADYEDPIGKFERVRAMFGKDYGTDWSPGNMSLARWKCRHGERWAASLKFESTFLTGVGEELTSVGLPLKNNHWHITLGYPKAWELSDDYRESAEYQYLERKVQEATWQLTLLKIGATDIEKHSSFVLKSRNEQVN